MGVRVILLQECPLVLSLIKHKRVGAFLNQKEMRISHRGSPLNSSIDIGTNNNKKIKLLCKKSGTSTTFFTTLSQQTTGGKMLLVLI